MRRAHAFVRRLRRRLVAAAAIILGQIPLSAWWLSRYRFGPIEWIWRRLTYGQPLALRPPA